MSSYDLNDGEYICRTYFMFIDKRVCVQHHICKCTEPIFVGGLKWYIDKDTFIIAILMQFLSGEM